MKLSFVATLGCALQFFSLAGNASPLVCHRQGTEASVPPIVILTTTGASDLTLGDVILLDKNFREINNRIPQKITRTSDQDPYGSRRGEMREGGACPSHKSGPAGQEYVYFKGIIHTTYAYFPIGSKSFSLCTGQWEVKYNCEAAFGFDYKINAIFDSERKYGSGAAEAKPFSLRGFDRRILKIDMGKYLKGGLSPRRDGESVLTRHNSAESLLRFGKTIRRTDFPEDMEMDMLVSIPHIKPEDGSFTEAAVDFMIKNFAKENPPKHDYNREYQHVYIARTFSMYYSKDIFVESSRADALKNKLLVLISSSIDKIERENPPFEQYGTNYNYRFADHLLKLSERLLLKDNREALFRSGDTTEHRARLAFLKEKNLWK